MNDINQLKPYLAGDVSDMSEYQIAEITRLSKDRFEALLSFLKNQHASDQTMSWTLLSKGHILSFLKRYGYGASALKAYDGVMDVSKRVNKEFWDGLNEKLECICRARYVPTQIVPEAGWSNFQASPSIRHGGVIHRKPGHT